MIRHFLVSAALSTTLSSAAIAGDWVADFDEAVKLAQTEGKDLLVDFTGSDWCGWCIRLHDEVFVHSEFLEPVQKEFVLVALDFPRGEEALAKVPNMERNREISEQHGISGFPTVLLMTPAGDVYGRSGYREGGPESYVKHLEELRKEGIAALTEVKEIIAAYQAAEGEAKVPALLEVMDALEGQSEDSAFKRLLAEPIKAGWQALPDSAQRRAIRLVNGAGQADEDTFAAAKRLDPKNEHGLYAESLQMFMEGVSAEDQIPPALVLLDEFTRAELEVASGVGESLYLLGAYWSKEYTEDLEAAKRYAQIGLKYTMEEKYKDFFEEILNG